MAFSKIAGFEVTPRSEYSSISRCSSPSSIRLRRIWSSQTEVPAFVSAASRSLTPTLTPMKAPPLAPRADSVHRLPRHLGGVRGGDAEVLVHRGGRPGLAERVHSQEQAVLAYPAVP